MLRQIIQHPMPDCFLRYHKYLAISWRKIGVSLKLFSCWTKNSSGLLGRGLWRELTDFRLQLREISSVVVHQWNISQQGVNFTLALRISLALGTKCLTVQAGDHAKVLVSIAGNQRSMNQSARCKLHSGTEDVPCSWERNIWLVKLQTTAY